IDRDVLLAARSVAIRNLHALLVIPDAHISDATLAAVVRLVLSDLCVGEIDELRMHSDGIRDMTGFRGGLAALGMDGRLAKMLSTYTNNLLDTPLDPPTTAMLKDLTFLLDTVLALPPSPSQWQLRKVQSVCEWVQGRLSSPSPSISPSRKDRNALQRTVRLASLVYCNAIRGRRRLADVLVGQGEDGEGMGAALVRAAGAVPLEAWEGKGVMGTLVGVLAGVLAMPVSVSEGCAVRARVVAAAVQLALVDWGEAVGAFGRVVRLQAWLRGDG
ncbi:hypothetical protein C8A05DRAFT_13632, partial [Staphylotrichum tortipilum]